MYFAAKSLLLPFALLTLSAVLSMVGGHLSFISVVAMSLMWGSFAISYRRRHQLRAARVKGELDEAYALSGASSQHLRVMVEADPAPKGARVDAEEEMQKKAIAEAEAEAEKEDAFSDFDRRLAEAEKKKQAL